jgi:transposase
MDMFGMKKAPKLTTEQITDLHHIIRNGTGTETRKAQAILLINQEADARAFATHTTYTEKHAYRLRRLFLRHGTDAVADKRKPRPKTLRTRRQRSEIIETVKAKTPNDIDRYYNGDYWTTGSLGEYILRTYGVQYKSKTSYYLIFRESKFTYHKLGKVSERRNEQELQEWRTKAKKRIAEAWNDPETVMLAEDEMHLSTQTTTQKIWLPQGEYPSIEVVRKREARSVYGFLDIKAGRDHAFKTQWQNMYITAHIIPEIGKLYTNKKILLLWDQAGWRKGREAQRAIKEDGNIETMYFPTAAPEENP